MLAALLAAPLAAPAAADSLAGITPVRAAVLGAVQGVTEFLPISSSAHLYIVPELLGWRYEGVAFDVALHWGTLLALLAAFWREWLGLFNGSFARGARGRSARGTLLRLAVASVPAALAGLLLEDAAGSVLRSMPLQAVMLAVFGLVLWAVDRFAPQRPPADGAEAGVPGWGRSLLIGCAQALALVPAVTRSGITMTAGRAAAMDRVSAARFSFLLATPITFGAGLLELRRLPEDLPAAALATGMLASAVVGLAAIRGLLRWLGRAGFGAFALYRLALAAFLVAWLALR